MRPLLKSLLIAGTLVLTACGVEAGDASTAPELETAEQAILPQCRVGQNTRIYFYSDSAKTVEVGRRTCACDGTITNSGQTTSLWNSYATACN